jgi:hypothetical protein
MAKRSKIYESETAQKPKDPEYAEGYLNSAIFNQYLSAGSFVVSLLRIVSRALGARD